MNEHGSGGSLTLGSIDVTAAAVFGRAPASGSRGGRRQLARTTGGQFNVAATPVGGSMCATGHPGGCRLTGPASASGLGRGEGEQEGTPVFHVLPVGWRTSHIRPINMGRRDGGIAGGRGAVLALTLVVVRRRIPGGGGGVMLRPALGSRGRLLLYVVVVGRERLA